MGTQQVNLEHAGEKSAVDGSDPFVHLFIQERIEPAQPAREHAIMYTHNVNGEIQNGGWLYI